MLGTVVSRKSSSFGITDAMELAAFLRQFPDCMIDKEVTTALARRGAQSSLGLLRKYLSGSDGVVCTCVLKDSQKLHGATVHSDVLGDHALRPGMSLREDRSWRNFEFSFC